MCALNSTSLVPDLWGHLCLKQSMGEEITYTIRRDDGYSRTERLAFYFDEAVSETEAELLAKLKGPVLDLGCGPGRSTRFLRSRNIRCIPADASNGIAELFQTRADPSFLPLNLNDLSAIENMFAPASLGSILMNGNNLGLTGSLDRLQNFLALAHSKLVLGGTFLASSIDFTQSQAPQHQRYQKQNIKAGKYPGVIRIQLQWQNWISPYWDLLLLAKSDVHNLLLNVGFKNIHFTDFQHTYFVSAEK